MSGPRGVGKTNVVAQIASDNHARVSFIMSPPQKKKRPSVEMIFPYLIPAADGKMRRTPYWLD